MKKLMFVVAAALCGSLFAEGIASKNVVGYQTLDNGDQAVMMGCQFVDVSDGVSGVKVGNVVGEFSDFDLIEVASCDAEGHISFTAYTYLTEEGSGFPNGWYDEELSSADEEPISLSAAVWFTGSDSAKSVTISGQVYDRDYTHSFSAPTEMVCSAFPLPFCPNDIDKVVWAGLTDFDLIEVASCDSEGHVSFAAYTYLTEEGAGFPDGWYDEELNLAEAVAIGGQGFWLTLANPTSVTLKEISPLAK